MGLEPKDLDYVCVGYTHEDMIAEGFKLIEAQAFPVYRHPVTYDEYALARKEIKSGTGYHNFECSFDPTITLAEDQYRRDLTINQLAVSIDDWDDFVLTKSLQYVIDGYGGLRDLQNSTLRHVSHHFSEDPVRFLRIARFAARYGFAIADSTSELLNDISFCGELKALTAERVWTEVEKTLPEMRPLRFFKEVEFHGGLEDIFGSHIANEATVIDDKTIGPIMASRLTRKPYRFAAWTRFMKKGSIHTLCQKIKVPNEYKEAALFVNDFYTQMTDETVDPFDFDWMKTFLKSHNALRNTERLWPLMRILEADVAWTGRYPAGVLAEWVYHFAGTCNSIKLESIPEEEREGLVGKAIGDRIEEIQRDAVKALFENVFANRI
jgi:tRNA nucleotidyltransferase (CCA-adding enzyme)